MDRELKKREKKIEKDFFRQLVNSVFRKTMENAKKHTDIKFLKTKRQRNNLVSEQNYHTTKRFSENLLAIETKKQKQSSINQPNEVFQY